LAETGCPHKKALHIWVLRTIKLIGGGLGARS
jgi:hypothetical protein